MPFCRVAGSGIPRRQTGVSRGIGSGNRRPCLGVVFSACWCLDAFRWFSLRPLLATHVPRFVIPAESRDLAGSVAPPFGESHVLIW